eukprot:TRINITY_DN1225_c0_g1_i1.p1 TRINITY_DN1225_c0_g1~~TRINITY_DN1225_c0_g1_i1.p1  ORF type:complete len:178 (+),score=66.49 TRINITY_DN1225_c0_g1_i1:62-535(+)
MAIDAAPTQTAGTKRPAEVKDPKSPSKHAKLDDAQLDLRKLFKEGQKAVTPPVSDATRAFYESLLEENPDSKIAIKYCVEQGLMSLEQHNILLKKYNKLKEKGAFNANVALKKIFDKKEGKEGKEGKEKKDKKDKKEKKEGKEGKEKKEKKEEPKPN